MNPTHPTLVNSTSQSDSSRAQASHHMVRDWIADAILQAQHIWDKEDARETARDAMTLSSRQLKRLRITGLPLPVVPKPIDRLKGKEHVLMNLGQFIEPQDSIHDSKKSRLLNPPLSGKQIMERWAVWAAWEQDVALDNSLVTCQDLAPGEWVQICKQ
ncbi:hypothetical protein Moror_17169 [Moniliophthora roreri MCA 2997]|uniref:Uncharacterized protein n=2 Tax=Moniliophthora roreri TaxID=221103 RepID=V2Y0M1_MONRO|nr:hypothetical protein Moror_17169 [Moniliophthora roreri MCA 2997]